MESHTLASLYDFENTEGIFPNVHRSYKFCLLTITGFSAYQEASFVFFLHQVSDLKDEQRRFTLNAEDIRLFNPNTHTCPIFRSKHDMEIVKTIYKHLPVILKEDLYAENPWSIALRKGIFNMAGDSSLFCTQEHLRQGGGQFKQNIFYQKDEKYLPLYEGKMIGAFDHRAGEYGSETEDIFELRIAEHSNPWKLPLPRYWVHESNLPTVLKDGRSALLVFRDIARATHARTAISSIIPNVPCGDTLQVVFL